jgi:hypothetical protein
MLIIIPVGDQLLRKLTLAIPQCLIHHRAFGAFTASMRIDNPGMVNEWEQQILKWEIDQSQPCPYDLPVESKF